MMCSWYFPEHIIFLSFCGVPKKTEKSLRNLELQLSAGVTYNMMKETTYIYLYIYIYTPTHTHTTHRVELNYMEVS